jgi:hypothetical protein
MNEKPTQEPENLAASGSPCSARLGREDAHATPAFASGEYMAQMCNEIDRLRAEIERLDAVRDDWSKAMDRRNADIDTLWSALRVLAAFVRTVPGSLPERVQDAVDLVPSWDDAAVFVDDAAP